MTGKRGSPKALDVVTGAHSDHPRILKRLPLFRSPELTESPKLLPGLVAIYTYPRTELEGHGPKSELDQLLMNGPSLLKRGHKTINLQQGSQCTRISQLQRYRSLFGAAYKLRGLHKSQPNRNLLQYACRLRSIAPLFVLNRTLVLRQLAAMQ